MAVIDFELPPPPRRDDVLFRSDRTLWPANACMTRGEEFAYREGYRRGANRLVEYVCAEARDQDFLVYPIVYLYRHHVELILKRLILLTANLANEELTEKCSKDLEHHRIDELWNDLKFLLTKTKIQQDCGLTLDSEDVSGVDSYIKQLSKLDPDSQRFRYAHLKNGASSLPDGLEHINIAVFGSHMESLCTYLDGIDTCLDHMLEMRDEMEAEYRSAMYSDYDGGW
jgi:hypothetical protein